MSVGGVVTGIDRIKEADRLRIRTREINHPGDLEVCVEVDRNETTKRITIGDSFWWQSGNCYWTPRTFVLNLSPDTMVDTPIPKLSGSYQYPFDSLEKQKRYREALQVDGY